MADVTSQALVPPPSASLWPQPPQQQQGALMSNPGAVIDLANKLQQNYLMNQELKSRAAIGQAYQGALQPDGTVDPERLRAGLSNPDANWQLPDAVSRMQQQTRTQFDTRAAQDQAVRQVLGNLPPNATDEQIYGVSAQLSRLGVPGNLIEGWRSSIPPQGSPKRAQAIQSIQNLALSPGEATAPRTIVGPQGEQRGTTAAEYNRQVTGEGGVGGAGPAGPAGRTAAPAGSVATSLPPGGATSAETMQADLNREANFAADVTPMREASSAINSLITKYGSTGFGPGTEGRRQMESYLQSASPTLARFFGVDPSELRDYNSAKKYLTQMAQTRAQAFGPHSNEGLATSVSGTPNLTMDDLSVPELINVNIGLRRSQYAQVQQSKQSGGPNYLSTKADWASKTDPRAFTLDLLSPDARQKLLDSIKPGTAEAKRFNNSLRAAYDTGVMDRQSAPGAQTRTPAATTPTRPPPRETVRSLPPENLGTQSVVSQRSPAAAPVSSTPPLPGARLGRRPDGSPGWYIPDPTRPGKHLEVYTLGK